ncbi:translesion DNA polymerase - REV1 deoxycytidyl transferase [Moesziomyces antarcticus T-34]|uniref:DNA repair protein REV1 n=1 Tax=Pseudozyma antarctica (strain T-34) TaxID=1151754 RepID=M9LKQ3_PSEA3|nr:translesion DNA polymerase - REV1 deoxycytidyl transferase [Moesziomyces antarcticus T-34]
MHRPSIRQLSDTDPEPGPSRKRKVQWADEDDRDDARPLALEDTAQVHFNETRVDENGMPIIVSTTDSEDAEAQAEPPSKDAADSKAHDLELRSEIYNPIEYGDFRSYMKHKRAKLKVQEAALLQEEEALLRVQADASDSTAKQSSLAAEIEAEGGQRSDALKGCCIYINGQTHPPYSELRRLLVLHGGDLMAYLDQKSPVTHIVASNLTPKKRIEFKDYKVVLPGWILESIELGRKADWRKWRCDAITGSNSHTSHSMVARTAQQQQGASTGVSDWRNLDRTAKLPKPLPRIGDEDQDTPWGKPTNQTTLLDRFTRTDNQSSIAPSVQKQSDVVADVTNPADASTASKGKGVRFGEHHLIEPVPPLPEEKSLPPVPEPVTPTKPKDMIPASVGTDPASKKAALAVTKSHYASRPSNTHAARLLASPSWRERNTATSEGFLAGYFAKSRLHHLSTWKTSLQDMVSSALREAGRPLASADLPKGVQRVIMHIDFDSFFVAVGLRKRPDLHDKPVVVCHGTGVGMPAQKPGDENKPADNQSSSTSEIASCSYKAREFGIRNGMSLGQAKRLCPHVETIPYDFEAYNNISLSFYAFLLEHSDALQAVSVDEALVDVSLLLQSMRDGDAAPGSLYDRYRDHLGSQGDAWSAEKQLAEAFRDEIRDRCGCEASIGIGSNILLARLATRRAKPGGSFHLTDDSKQPFLDELDVDDLHGIGWSLRERLREMFETINVGQILAKTTERKLTAEFGPKKGKMIWDKMHGIDADRLEGNKLRQSVGSHVNYGIRFLTEQEAETFVTGMCQEVAQRTRAVKLRGRQVSVQVMVRAKDAPVEAPKFLGHGVCDTHHRSVQVSGPGGVAIDDEERIRAAAWPLIRDLRADPKELRGIAISLNKLEPAEGNALSPAKPKGGQAVLNFHNASSSSKAAPKQSAVGRETVLNLHKTSKLNEDDDADGTAHEQIDEPGLELPESLEKGPTAGTSRRPTAASAAQGSVERTPAALPLSTQLMLPSRSQIDPDVFEALPTPYRRQIQAKFGEDTISEPSSQTRARVLPRSTPTTPQKAKAAPSAAMAEAIMLPSASQIDPAVLAELPASVRKEIERQVGLVPDDSAGTSSVESTPTRRKNATTATLTRFLKQDPKHALFRSASESPTKKRLVNRLLHTAGQYAPKDQRAVDREELLAMDPSKIAIETLKGLGIDAEVFRALPMELQRETFRHHSEQRKSEQARFKAGKTSTFEELTHAEQRRRDTLRAAHSDPTAPPAYLVARPRWRIPRAEARILDSEPQSAVEVPSIRGLTRYEDVEQLIRQWVAAFAVKGPRRGDVDRIATYLAETLRVAAQTRVEEAHKTDAILRLINEAISQEGDKGKLVARDAWRDAVQRIRSAVQAQAHSSFHGAHL